MQPTVSTMKRACAFSVLPEKINMIVPSMGCKGGEMNFDDWFEKQFGSQPGPALSLPALWDQADSLRRQLRIIEGHISSRERWFAQRKAALYAWNVRGKDKLEAK